MTASVNVKKLLLSRKSKLSIKQSDNDVCLEKCLYIPEFILGFIFVLYFSGLMPISLESLHMVRTSVADIPRLNDHVYQSINDGLYISHNDYKKLHNHWAIEIKKW